MRSSTRSTSGFADANGDGIGDLAGDRERLPYLATWASTPSGSTPGTLAAGRRRLRRLRLPGHRSGLRDARGGRAADRGGPALGIRTIVDVVPNHVSDQHPWFRAALASPPGRPRGSASGSGPARATTASCRRTAGCRTSAGPPGPGDATDRRVVPAPVRPRAAGPQLEAPRRAVRARGHPPLLVRPRRRRRPDRLGRPAGQGPGARRGAARRAPGEHPFTDRDELHEIYRRWRAVADSYDEPRVLVGEIWLPDPTGSRATCGPTSCTPRSTSTSSRARGTGPIRALDRLDTRGPRAGRRPGHVGALEPRRHPAGDALRPGRHLVRLRDEAGGHADRPRARTRRARAAALLAMALPGSMYVYQGEELGLPEVEDIPPSAARTRCGSAPAASIPAATAAGCRCPGRAAARRTASAPTAPSAPWLDQPDDWAPLTVAAQTEDPTSMLALYRAGLRIRREPGGAGALRWLALARVIAFARGEAFVCIVNFGPEPVSCRTAPTSLSAAMSSKEVRFRRTPRSGSARPGKVRRTRSEGP